MASRLPHYCVVGGGISGLSSAYFLSLARPPGSYRLTVLEASPRFGGWIQSIRNPNTGAVYELGPHSARYGGPTSTLLLRLALSLDLQDSLLWMRSNQEAGKKYIYVDGRLVSISPLSLIAKKPFTRSPIGLLVRKLFASRPPIKPDLSVDEFLRTRFDDEFADYLGSALMRGVYAGDSRELSARACLPQVSGCNLWFGVPSPYCEYLTEFGAGTSVVQHNIRQLERGTSKSTELIRISPHIGVSVRHDVPCNHTHP
ncbi:hypothetical protein P879_09183 [Paragonimus westermani]|uniref:Protoporphyrinogen oxidase n=1 Tax=Paragonimus westermani TaxID=34504 RepID=A0A8T0DA57_9TREM|nr:hypothetical protein P879_09183 [Paragonimus westermani]